MTVQTTSYQSYASIIETLGRRQSEVLECLKVHGSMTNHEIAFRMGREINTICPRILELRNKGIVCSSGTKVDVTGRRAMVWACVYPDELF